LQNKRTTVILGSLLTTVSFGWFFHWYLSLSSYQLRGLEGVEQTILFVVTSLTATGCNYLISSIIQHFTNPQFQEKRPVPTNLPIDGIEMLRTFTLTTLIYAKRNKHNV
jgi:hypothetical protein